MYVKNFFEIYRWKGSLVSSLESPFKNKENEPIKSLQRRAVFKLQRSKGPLVDKGRRGRDTKRKKKSV